MSEGRNGQPEVVLDEPTTNSDGIIVKGDSLDGGLAVLDAAIADLPERVKQQALALRVECEDNARLMVELQAKHDKEGGLSVADMERYTAAATAVESIGRQIFDLAHGC